MRRRGWTLLFHDGVVEQLERLHRAAERAKRADPKGFERNANVKLFQVLSHPIVEAIPSDPSRDEYRLGNTMGPAYRHWRRAKIGRRFRLYFRYDSKAKVIVYAWVNDEDTLRIVRRVPRGTGRPLEGEGGALRSLGVGVTSAGSKSDPYAVFKRMLDRGNPPDHCAALVAASRADWTGE